jgi:hypothetical protein
MKKFLPFLFIAALGLQSCENFINGVVKTIDLPAHESQLAGTLFLDSRDSSITALISASKGVFDSTKSQVINGAQCRLLVDGSALYSWSTQDWNGNYVELLSDRVGAPQGEITFEVTHPDFDTIYATQSFPPMPEASASVAYGATQVFNQPSDELTLVIKDLPGQPQYYRISVAVHFRTALTGQDTSQYYETWAETAHPNAQMLWGKSGSFIVSDEGINKDLEIKVATGINPLDFTMLHEYRIEISALSDATYDFYKSYMAYQNSQGNPFAEPVVLYSNMNNSMGCFGLSTTKVVRK